MSSYQDLARVERAFRCLKTVGLPLHSFSTLLDHLATRCRPRRFPTRPPFDCDTEPTPLQGRALELVRLFPVAFNR